MTTYKTCGVACLWLISLSGCAFQTEAETAGETETAEATTQNLRRRTPAPAPTVAPAPAPTSSQPPASSTAVCAPGTTLPPTMTPPGYSLSSITVGTSTLLMLVPDDTAKPVPLPAGYRVQCFTTSYGERLVQLIPPASPSVDVLPGGKCGVVDQNGAFLQCVVGSTCLSSGNNQAGICQGYASAPVSEL